MHSTDEIEIEWRRRVSMLEAQRLLWHMVRGKERVVVEQYRVRHHGEVHRRLGQVRVYDHGSFNFTSFDDLLALLDAPLARRPRAAADASPLSLVKLTTCFHTMFFFDPDVSLAENNQFPRVFCCKRSRELVDWVVDEPAQTEPFEPRTPPPDDYPLDLSALNAALREQEMFEMDRSDNNLGLRFYRKVYYLTEANVRLCLYAILDEFGTVSYELGVEREAEAASRCGTSSTASPRSVPSALLNSYMTACSAVIHEAVQHLEHVECPVISLTTGWIHDNNDHTPMRSLSCDPTVTRHVRLYEVYLNNLLRAALSSPDSDDVLIKLKIDGVRLFAVYDGDHRLCCTNGVEIDLAEHLPLPADTTTRYGDVFSTDFVYQLEQLDEVFFITDVVDIRNRYVANIQPFQHGFSAAVPKYKKQPGQEWPYYIVGTTLADRADLIEEIKSAKSHACHAYGASKAANCAAAAAAPSAAVLQQPVENHDFVPVTIAHSRVILDALDRALKSLAPSIDRKFHVNGFYQPAALFPTIVRERFGRWQFLATYKQLLALFGEHPTDRDVVLELLERCGSNMFSDDLAWLTRPRDDTRAPASPGNGHSLDWFYALNVERLFDHVDGLLMYRKARRVHARRQTSRCSFGESTCDAAYEAFKIKTFQTVELMYSEQDGGRVRYFKTDNFYRKFYFKREERSVEDGGENADPRRWVRFDMVEVRLCIPQRFWPLVPLSIYEILCESETQFYLVAVRNDKFVPDSNFKVNSIVFARQQLQDALAVQRRSRSAVMHPHPTHKTAAAAATPAPPTLAAKKRYAMSISVAAAPRPTRSAFVLQLHSLLQVE